MTDVVTTFHIMWSWIDIIDANEHLLNSDGLGLGELIVSGAETATHHIFDVWLESAYGIKFTWLQYGIGAFSFEIIIPQE